MKKKIIFAVLSVLFVFCLLYFIPLPKKIDKTLEGHCYVLEETDFRQLDQPVYTIHIKGTHYRYLLRDNVFRGDVRLGDFLWRGTRYTAVARDSGVESFFPLEPYRNIILEHLDFFSKVRLTYHGDYDTLEDDIYFFAPSGAVEAFFSPQTTDYDK